MLNLNPFAISGLLIIITYLPLFILIALKGKTKVARIFSLHILSIFLWGIGTCLIATNNKPDNVEVIFKLSYLPVIFIPVFLQHAVLIMTNSKSKLVLYFIYIQAIYFVFLTLNNKMFHDFRLIFNSFYYSHANANTTTSLLFWVIIVSFTHFQLIHYYQKTYPEQKKQIFLLIIAAIGFVGGLTNFFLGYTENIYPYGNFLIPLHSIIVTYAILKHQLLEIDIVIKRSIVYSILITLVSLSYLLIVFLMEKFIQAILGYKSILISIATAFLLGIIIVPLRNRIQYFVDRIVFKGSQPEIAQQNELLKQEVARSEKLKSVATLASGIAHEIKNPLTALKTFSEYLPNRLEDKEFLLKFSRIAGNEVTRIDKLVHELLDFAKPGPLTLKETNINKLIDDTLNFFDSEFIKHNIKLSKDLNVTIILKVDSNQLRQAFMNLFINAIEAMPQGGELRIKAANSNDSMLQILIEDSGCGIAKEDLLHIFDPFYSKKDGGTGLGLSITYGIIKEHKGTISATSKLGKGTVFIIELPIAS